MPCRTLIALTVSVVFAAASAGCGGDRSTSSTVDVEFTRANGSFADMPTTVRAWCGPFDEDNGDDEGVHVLAGDRPPSPYWIVDAVRADIERDPTTTFPNSFDYTKPRGAALFVFDADDRGNELSSADEESSGTIKVEYEGCDTGDSVTVAFDDVELGSEYHDMPPLSVSGTVLAEIGDPPF